MTMQRRCLAAATAAALVLPIASCAAEQPADYIDREIITLPFPGGTDAERLKQSYQDAVSLLKKRAIEEVRDAEYRPQAGSYAIFPASSARPWVVFGAVTPRKGVFYAVPYGHYASLEDYKNGRVERRNGTIDVCRMEMRWEKFPGGPVVQGLKWAGMHMSGVDCVPPPVEQLAMLEEWQNRKVKPDYALEGKTSEGKLSVALIREVKPKDWPYRPFDAVGASAKMMDAGDGVSWAIPLIDNDRTASVVATRSGRLLAYFTDSFYARDLPDLMCVADGLSWANLAEEPRTPEMQAAQRFCRDLTTQYQTRRTEELRRNYEKAPPTIRSIPQTLKN